MEAPQKDQIQNQLKSLLRVKYRNVVLMLEVLRLRLMGRVNLRQLLLFMQLQMQERLDRYLNQLVLARQLGKMNIKLKY